MSMPRPTWTSAVKLDPMDLIRAIIFVFGLGLAWSNVTSKVDQYGKKLDDIDKVYARKDMVEQSNAMLQSLIISISKQIERLDNKVDTLFDERMRDRQK